MPPMKTYFSSNLPHDRLLNVAVHALQHVRKTVKDSLADGSGLEASTFSSPEGKQKRMLQVDKTAENACRNTLLAFVKDLSVLGEETLWKLPKSLDLSKEHVVMDGTNPKVKDGAETRVTAILDMIDGSDLVERNLNNWCSALIFFQPTPAPKILFSMIHDADGRIYGAHEQGTFLIDEDTKPGDVIETLNGPELRKLRREDPDRELPEEIDQIAICFYAQKGSHFTTIPPGFSAWVRNTPATKRLRIYDLAGNPMMARLANGENIHAVFEHRGQYPHDAVPGGYIGLQAGAQLLDFADNNIVIGDLAQKLLRPSAGEFQYVMASTKEIALDLTRAMREVPRLLYNCPSCQANVKVVEHSVPPYCKRCDQDMQKSVPAEVRAVE